MKRWIALLLLMLVLCPAQAERTRETVRERWREVGEWRAETLYRKTPRATAPYEAGTLNPEAVADALNYLNFLRWLAGLDAVHDSRIYNDQCQRAAVLLAAIDYVDHNAPKPDDMDANFYDAAHLGTSSGNIARFNWTRDTIIREGLSYFARDDGEQNLPALGHRRWLLNPTMAATGFGLCQAASGMSYVVMYAHDMGNPDVRWTDVRWPAPGAFPAELMHDHLAWSIVLNPAVYDLENSDPAVTLSEDALGLRFRFRPAQESGDGYCRVNPEPYGAGDCLIFRPDFSNTRFTDYQQNQRWHVRIEGLMTRAGTVEAIDYTVTMISLHPQDPVNVEISPLSADLRVGETLTLSAQVIPVYADDLSVRWWSTDEAVARVDDNGTVTAISPGQCEVICIDALGHQDACALTVRDH